MRKDTPPNEPINLKYADDQSTVSSPDFNYEFSVAPEPTKIKRQKRRSLIEDCLSRELLDAVENAVLEAIPAPSPSKPRSAANYCGDLPERIGDYVVSDFIGKGSFGAVYRGEHARLHSNVAIKLSLHPLLNTELRQRFITEANIANKLIHPNIVRAINVDQLDDGRCFIIFDFVEGQDLKAYLKTNEVTTEHATDIFIQILSGIEFAHSEFVVHRDIKPSNILISKTGTPKISDFGVALLNTHSRNVREVAGTIRYMAPEQIEGQTEKIDARTDIFALGLVFAEMLTGRSLQRTASEAKCTTDMERLFEKSGVPKELQRICEKCCAFDSHARYQSVKELSYDIQQWLSTTQRSKRLAELNERELGVGLRPYTGDKQAVFRTIISDELSSSEIPELVNYWKSRIERQGTEPTFQIGALSGPPFCGKTSLILAGLIPYISSTTIVEYCDCRNFTNLVNAVTHTLERTIPSTTWPAESKKRLVIFDHLMLDSQDYDENQTQQITSALAQAANTSAQVLFIVNDTEKPRLTKLLDIIGITLDPQENYLALHAPSAREIKTLLIKLGTAYGCFSGKAISPANHQFIDGAIEQMTEAGCPDYATAQVFFDAAKNVDWVSKSFEKIGSVANWQEQYVAQRLISDADSFSLFSRVFGAFLQSDQSAHFNLPALIESTVEEAKQSEIQSALVQSTGLFTRQTNIDLPETETTNNQSDHGSYFLSQSYLRPAISAFSQSVIGSKSWAGRQVLTLQRDAGLWAGNSKLPIRTVNVAQQLLASFNHKRTELESRYLYAAAKKVAARAIVLAISLIAIVCIFSVGMSKFRTTQITNSTSNDILQYRHSNNSLGFSNFLASTINDPSQRLSARLNAAFAYSQFNECPVEFLVDASETASSDNQEIIAETFELSADRSSTIRTLQEINARLNRSSDFEKRLRVGLFLARLDQSDDLRQTLGIDSDPNDRTRAIAALSKWFGGTTILRTCEVLESDAGIVSALLNSINPDSKEEPSQTLTPFQVKQINKLYDFHSSGAVRMAAHRLIDKFELAVPRQLANTSSESTPPPKLYLMSLNPTENSSSKNWFVNSLGQTMIRLPQRATNEGKSVYMSALEFTCDEFAELTANIPKDKQVEEALRFVSKNPVPPDGGYPINGVLEGSAFEICNLLSEREGRGKCYKRIGFDIRKRQAIGYIQGIYEFDFSQNGYRLPFASEWQATVMLKEKLSHLGDHTNRERASLFENLHVHILEKTGSRLPNRFGFCDLAGNSCELTHDVETYDLWLTNGTFTTNLPETFGHRRFTPGFRGAPFVSIRVCCSD